MIKSWVIRPKEWGRVARIQQDSDEWGKADSNYLKNCKKYAR